MRSLLACNRTVTRVVLKQYYKVSSAVLVIHRTVTRVVLKLAFNGVFAHEPIV